jgi:nicotinamidase-related amidase
LPACAAGSFAGKKPEDFLTLTDDPSRKIVMLVGPDGLESLLGKTGYEMLVTIGYQPDYLRHKVEEGNRFKLVVFPEGGPAKAATWDNVIDLVCDIYPAAAAMVRRHRVGLKQFSFAEIEQDAGFVFLDVEKAGPSDPKYMTYERLLDSRGDLADVRAFLYFTVHLREQFSGDGYTYDDKGNRGVMEYIVPNKPLTALGPHEIFTLDVRLPASAKKGDSLMTETAPNVADFMPLSYTPKFFRPEKAYEDYSPDIAGAMMEGVEYALKHGLDSASKLMERGIKNAIMLTDLQNDFRNRRWRLGVEGTDDVVLRIASRIINGTVNEYYSGLVESLDGHSKWHTSFGIVWRDRNGRPLDLRQTKVACLRLFDEKKAVFEAYSPADGSIIGYYQRLYDPLNAVKYWKHLQATGQGDIWVFDVHCVLGTDGADQHPLIVEAVSFLCGARSIKPTTIYKGHIDTTDWFGPLEPCMTIPGHPQGGFNKEVVEQIKLFDTEFAGVAGDFCDYYMKKQTMTYLSGTPYMHNLRFITDGTAYIIPNAPHVIAQDAEAERQGVRFITHDTPFAQS